MRTLIADDDPVSRRWLESGLRRLGHEPIVACDGAEAWEALRCEGKPTLAILDWTMPRMDGLEVCRRVRASADGAPTYIIMLAVGDRKEDIARGLSAGADDFVVKAFDEGELRARVGVGVRVLRLRKRLRARTRLERARQARLKVQDSLLSCVSHELRAPLHGISQSMELLLSGAVGSLSEEQRKYLEIGLRDVETLAAMVGDLVDAARARAGKLAAQPVPCRAAALVDDVVTRFTLTAAERGVMLTHEAPADLPAVHADPRRIQQVLANLVGNALKFTPAGGTVRVRACPAEPSWLRFSVEDTGCGVPAPARGRIFERFYQAESAGAEPGRGLGLGLFICRELVTQHGGRIWCESEAGRGSTFAFTLPLAHVAAADGVEVSPAIAEAARAASAEATSAEMVRVTACSETAAPRLALVDGRADGGKERHGTRHRWWERAVSFAGRHARIAEPGGREPCR